MAFGNLQALLEKIKQEKKMAFLDTVKAALNTNKIIIVAADTSTHIENVLVVYKHNGIYEKVELDKSSVIKYIQTENRRFYTLNTEDGTLTDVHVVGRGILKYLRSDSNNTDEDNLGELPSVSFMSTVIDLKIK